MSNNNYPVLVSEVVDRINKAIDSASFIEGFNSLNIGAVSIEKRVSRNNMVFHVVSFTVACCGNEYKFEYHCYNSFVYANYYKKSNGWRRIFYKSNPQIGVGELYKLMKECRKYLEIIINTNLMDSIPLTQNVFDNL